MAALKTEILKHKLFLSLTFGRDATKHLVHYLGNTGRHYKIDLNGLANSVDSAKGVYETELAEAKAFVEKLHPGKHLITSTKASTHCPPERTNWFFAVGWYWAWGQGVAKVTEDKAGKRKYELEFEYKFLDQYDWHVHLSTILFKIPFPAGLARQLNGRRVRKGIYLHQDRHSVAVEVTDELMRRFHRQKLAREFPMYGLITELITPDEW